MSQPQAIVRLERIDKLKKFNDFIGIQIGDPPSCSIMPNPLPPEDSTYIILKNHKECTEETKLSKPASLMRKEMLKF
jgi:hypothetical protein